MRMNRLTPDNVVDWHLLADRRFEDFEELNELVQGWDLEVRQLKAGRSPAELLQIGRPEFMLTRFYFEQPYDQSGYESGKTALPKDRHTHRRVGDRLPTEEFSQRCLDLTGRVHVRLREHGSMLDHFELLHLKRRIALAKFQRLEGTLTNVNAPNRLRSCHRCSFVTDTPAGHLRIVYVSSDMSTHLKRDRWDNLSVYYRTSRRWYNTQQRLLS